MEGKRRKDVSMQDVARCSGVSVSTISRYFADRSTVSRGLGGRIEAAARECGYSHTPRKSAPAPEGKAGGGSVVMMVPNMQNPYFYELVDLVGQEVQRMGCFMILCINHNDPALMESQYKMMCCQKVLGCISACVATDTNQKWYGKAKKSIPMVTIQSDCDDCDSIMTADADGTFEMVEYLIELGHRCIAFIGHSWDIQLFSRRLSAYKNALIRHGIPVQSEYVGLCQSNARSGYEQACRILSLPRRPTAIHCFNTYTATGVYLAIRDNKLQIPRDISLSAFDDATIANVLTPALTVVSQPIEAIAGAAVQLLFERRKNGMDAPVQHISFPTTMVVRDSVSPLRKI